MDASEGRGASVLDQWHPTIPIIPPETPSPTSVLKPFPPLPLELVRMVFEMAGDDMDYPGALELTLCSKTVRRWLLPLIYDAVFLFRRPAAEPVDSNPDIDTLTTPMKTPPLQQFNQAISHSGVGQFVRSLLVEIGTGMEPTLASILRLCTNITSLHMNIYQPFHLLDIVDVNECPAPSNLGFGYLSPTFEQLLPDPAHPFVRNVRRLSLIAPNFLDLPLLHGFPNLKVLVLLVLCEQLDEPSDASQLLRVLELLQDSSFQSLRLLFRFVPDQTGWDLTVEPWSTLARVEDHRLIVNGSPEDDSWADKAARFTMGIWEAFERTGMGLNDVERRNEVREAFVRSNSD